MRSHLLRGYQDLMEATFLDIDTSLMTEFCSLNNNGYKIIFFKFLIYKNQILITNTFVTNVNLIATDNQFHYHWSVFSIATSLEHCKFSC